LTSTRSIAPRSYTAPRRFSIMRRPPPRSTLFPYTTLFRSSTGAPMTDHAGDFAAAFSDRPEPLSEIFYCAESVLLPEYRGHGLGDRKSTRLNSSHVKISYAVFCLKKKKRNDTNIRRVALTF